MVQHITDAEAIIDKMNGHMQLKINEIMGNLRVIFTVYGQFNQDWVRHQICNTEAMLTGKKIIHSTSNESICNSK